MSEPFVSVIMAVRNEAAFIAESLGAILEQDYPAERMEILLADGASEDDTLGIVRALPGAERIRIVSNPLRVQSAGLNLLIPESTGEFIIRIDGHTIIAKDYVRRCVETLLATSAQVVGGPMRPVGKTPMGRAIAAAGRSRFAVPTAFHVCEQACYTDTVYLGAWPRAVLAGVGGYDERLSPNEDYELNYRIRRAGGRIYLSPAISSRYFGRQTLGALARQYLAYGVAKTRTLRKYPGSLRPRQTVAPLFVVFLAVGVPLWAFLPIALVLWAALLALYVVCNATFSIAAAPQRSLPSVGRIALAFLTMHIAWGVGFWLGWFGKERGATPSPSSLVNPSLT
ncbi:MAG TPA: glycosyltransferase family 2 protein [Ktedonobacterales bacterium]|nr:glycosyltransferase family 2 protein [Ktedonobacterales bacterium]